MGSGQTPNHDGFRARREPYMVHGRGEGSKKNPQPSLGRLGILPACTLHSLFLEDLSVKDIQAGFLTLPTLTRLPIPSPEFVEGSKDSGFLVKALTPKKYGVGTTAAGPSPTSPCRGYGVPFTWTSTNDNSI